MCLSSVAFRPQTLRIEYVTEVLVGVQWSICKQLTVRADIRRLTTDSVLWIISDLVVLGTILFYDRSLEVRL